MYLFENVFLKESRSIPWRKRQQTRKSNPKPKAWNWLGGRILLRIYTKNQGFSAFPLFGGKISRISRSGKPMTCRFGESQTPNRQLAAEAASCFSEAAEAVQFQCFGGAKNGESGEVKMVK